MAQATISPPKAHEVDRLLQSLSVLAQAATWSRLHEHFLDVAGVRLDRTGAGLLAKLRHGDGGALRVTELAERLSVDAPTVTRKVQQLERLGLVAREGDPDDRRAHRIRLTAAGRRTLDRLNVVKVQWFEGLLEDWSQKDRDRLAELLGRFTDRLSEELEVLRGN